MGRRLATYIPVLPYPFNPLTRDTSSGALDPFLKIDRTIPFSQFIYYKGENLDDSASSTVKIFVIVCGNETLTKNASHPVYTIFATQDMAVATPELTFNLTDAFTFSHPDSNV